MSTESRPRRASLLSLICFSFLSAAELLVSPYGLPTSVPDMPATKDMLAERPNSLLMPLYLSTFTV